MGMVPGGCLPIPLEEDRKRLHTMTITQHTLSAKKRRILEILVIVLLAAVFMAIQLRRFPTPPWDQYLSWRQSDTYSMALNFAQYDMNPLQPQLNYDGTGGNYAQLELQIVPWLSAVLFRLLHTTSWAIPRGICCLFFLGSAAYLYLLLKQFTGTAASLAGLWVYMFIPLSMLIASSILPESCAMFFCCAAVYYLKRYMDTARPGFALTAAAMTALGIMEKTPMAFIGILFLYVLFHVLGKSAWKRPVFYASGLVALAPPVLFLWYTSRHSVFQFVDGIATKHVLSEKLFSLFTKDGLQFFYTAINDYFGWILVILAAIGLFLAVSKPYRFYLFWAVSFLLESATIIAAIRCYYYLVFMLPVCAALVSLTLQELAKCKRSVALVTCAATVIMTASLTRQRWPSTQVDASIDQVGQFIAENVTQEEGLAIAVINPAYLNAANRCGYRANIQYYDYIPTGPEAEIAYFIDHGVEKFVVVNHWVYNDAEGTYLAYLNDNFPISAESENCTIYDLTARKVS